MWRRGERRGEWGVRKGQRQGRREEGEESREGNLCDRPLQVISGLSPGLCSTTMWPQAQSQ